MAIPEFILALRAKVGTDPLWMSGVTAVTVRADPAGAGEQVLLVRRADTGEWTPVTGIIDPGEQPADAAVRESLEEAAVDVVARRLVLVHVSDPVTYDNGDRAQYLDLVFRMDWRGGEPRPADGENVAASWFAVDDLPPMAASMRVRIEAALAEEPAARFLGGGSMATRAGTERG